MLGDAQVEAALRIHPHIFRPVGKVVGAGAGRRLACLDLPCIAGELDGAIDRGAFDDDVGERIGIQFVRQCLFAS